MGLGVVGWERRIRSLLEVVFRSLVRKVLMRVPFWFVSLLEVSLSAVVVS